MALLADIFTNKIVISVILSFILANVIKMVFNYLAYDAWDFSVFFRTGGMPSLHAASVSSMTTAVYLLEGSTTLFYVCLVVTSIIISDAIGIRRSAGKQARVLNKMVDEFKYFKRFKAKRLHELLGHTPRQVFTGMIIGILVARIVFLF